jgi:hypothetical protein
MSAQAVTEACPHCGAEIPARARFCPECGTRLDDPANRTLAVELPDETAGPVPISMQRAEPRWFGIAPPTWLLVLAGIALFAAIVLFATAHWPFGLILLGIAALLLAAFMEVARHRPGQETQPRRGSPVRERTRSTWEEWRARSAAAAESRRLQSALLLVESERKRALADLGVAAHAHDAGAEAAARARLAELDEQERFLETQLEQQARAAGERIHRARLPVQDTMMVLPSEPAPPPDEANPPQPAVVPEPYPPPDEGTPPQPAKVPEPSPDQPGPDPEPARDE